MLKAEIPCDPLGEHSISVSLVYILSYNAYNATRYIKGRLLNIHEYRNEQNSYFYPEIIDAFPIFFFVQHLKYILEIVHL